MVVPRHIADRLLAETLGRPVMIEELRKLCDTVGGRTSGAPSGAEAEEWAIGLLRGWGLAVRTDDLPVRAWLRGTLEAEVRAPTRWRLTALAHGNAPAYADVTAPVVDLGHGERQDWERSAGSVGNRLALCDEGASEGRRQLHRTEKLAMAVEFGAAGLLMESSASGGLPRTGVCRRGEAPIPSIGISLEDGRRLRRLLASGVQPTARIAMSNRFVDGVARTVLADLPGVGAPGEMVIAGAHLDSWDVAQGAVDNGQGVAIVLEMARALASLGERPRRTLRFALWAAEEVGLMGSTAYVANHATELDLIAAVMNFDMTGDPTGFHTPGIAEPGDLLRGLARQLAPLGVREEFRRRATLHSDHQPFMLAGVPIVSVAGKLDEEGGRYYHAVGDTFDKVVAPAVCRASCVGATTMWALADAPERPLARLTPAAVRAMVTEADLGEALAAMGIELPTD